MPGLTLLTVMLASHYGDDLQRDHHNLPLLTVLRNRCHNDHSCPRLALELAELQRPRQSERVADAGGRRHKPAVWGFEEFHRVAVERGVDDRR